MCGASAGREGRGRVATRLHLRVTQNVLARAPHVVGVPIERALLAQRHHDVGRVHVKRRGVGAGVQLRARLQVALVHGRIDDGAARLAL